jgi:enolase-phosphatase E1
MIEVARPSHILLDIEGTTTSISFVHDTLFPYSAKNLDQFFFDHSHEKFLAEIIAEVQSTVKAEQHLVIDLLGVKKVLQEWIKNDRKHPALKRLQGRLWKKGYENRDYVTHLYPEVPTIIKQWMQKGIQIGIYSSGSVEAQKLLFQYTEAGNLNGFFSYYFDTRVGMKREKKSYQKIVDELEVAPDKILFLSDIAEELMAAQEVGLMIVHVLRSSENHQSNQLSKLLCIKDFTEICFKTVN